MKELVEHKTLMSKLNMGGRRIGITKAMQLTLDESNNPEQKILTDKNVYITDLTSDYVLMGGVGAVGGGVNILSMDRCSIDQSIDQHRC